MNVKVKFIGVVWNFAPVIAIIDIAWLFLSFAWGIACVFYEGDYAFFMWSGLLINFAITMMAQPIIIEEVSELSVPGAGSVLVNGGVKDRVSTKRKMTSCIEKRHGVLEG